jgi:hypothetical protein
MAIGVLSEGLQYLFELQKKHEEEFKSQNVWKKNARPPYLQTSYLLQLVICFASSKKAGCINWKPQNCVKNPVDSHIFLNFLFVLSSLKKLCMQ